MSTQSLDNEIEQLKGKISNLEDKNYDSEKKICRKISNLENKNYDLEKKICRLFDNIAVIEDNQRDAKLLYNYVERLYYSRITLSPELFERELKEFFKSTIDKRI